MDIKALKDDLWESIDSVNPGNKKGKSKAFKTTEVATCVCVCVCVYVYDARFSWRKDADAAVFFNNLYLFFYLIIFIHRLCSWRKRRRRCRSAPLSTSLT